jgi:four helix bundle protein
MGTADVDYKIKFREEIKLRLKSFVIRLIELARGTSYSLESKVVLNQLFRFGSSVYANYRAACRARSKAEFFSKLSIVLSKKPMKQKCGWTF